MFCSHTFLHTNLPNLSDDFRSTEFALKVYFVMFGPLYIDTRIDINLMSGHSWTVKKKGKKVPSDVRCAVTVTNGNRVQRSLWDTFLKGTEHGHCLQRAVSLRRWQKILGCSSFIVHPTLPPSNIVLLHGRLQIMKWSDFIFFCFLDWIRSIEKKSRSRCTLNLPTFIVLWRSKKKKPYKRYRKTYDLNIWSWNAL